MIDNLSSQMRQFETRRGAAQMKGTGWDRWFDAIRRAKENAEAAGLKWGGVDFTNTGDLKENFETQQLAQQMAGGDRSVGRWLGQRANLAQRGLGNTPEGAMQFGAAHFSPKGEAALLKQYGENQPTLQDQAGRIAELQKFGLPLDYNLENSYATGPGSMKDYALQDFYAQRNRTRG